jgi:hypothetical protein
MRAQGLLIEPYQGIDDLPAGEFRARFGDREFWPLAGNTSFATGAPVIRLRDESPKSGDPLPILTFSRTRVDLNRGSRGFTYRGKTYTLAQVGPRQKRADQLAVTRAYARSVRDGASSVELRADGKRVEMIMQIDTLNDVLVHKALLPYTVAHPDMLSVDVANLVFDDQRSDSGHRWVLLEGSGLDLNHISKEEFSRRLLSSVSLFSDRIENYDLPRQISERRDIVVGYRDTDPLPFMRRLNAMTIADSPTLKTYFEMTKGKVAKEITRQFRDLYNAPESLPKPLMTALTLEMFKSGAEKPNPADYYVMCYPQRADKKRPPLVARILERLEIKPLGTLQMHHEGLEELVVVNAKDPRLMQLLEEMRLELRGLKPL